MGVLLPKELWFWKLKMLPTSLAFAFLIIVRSVILREEVGTTQVFEFHLMWDEGENHQGDFRIKLTLSDLIQFIRTVVSSRCFAHLNLWVSAWWFPVPILQPYLLFANPNSTSPFTVSLSSSCEACTELISSLSDFLLKFQDCTGLYLMAVKSLHIVVAYAQPN